MNNKEKIVKKLLFDIIDKLSKDADVYNHNGSLWLINTDSARWIFEFTKSKTLWYNYNFFRSALKFVSLDVNEGDNQKYITEWFESRYLNINQVKHTLEISNSNPPGVEDTIQNGVKGTQESYTKRNPQVEDTIQNGVKQTELSKRDFFPEDIFQNGVKETKLKSGNQTGKVDDTIKNGVKDIRHDHKPLQPLVEDAIQNGVKETELHKGNRPLSIQDTIQNGVKIKPALESHEGFMMGTPYVDKFFSKEDVEDTIQNGVKDTKTSMSYQKFSVEDTIQNGVKHTRTSDIDPKNEVKDVIKNGVKNTWPDKIPNDYDWSEDFEDEIIDVIQEGVKEIQPLPAQDGNMDWGLYYQRQEDRTKPHTQYVRDVIEEHHHRRREVLVTIKDGVKETHQDCSNNIARVEGIIRVGEKLD